MAPNQRCGQESEIRGLSGAVPRRRQRLEQVPGKIPASYPWGVPDPIFRRRVLDELFERRCLLPYLRGRLCCRLGYPDHSGSE